MADEPTPDRLVNEAVQRHHTDAEFHAEVWRAVAVMDDFNKKVSGLPLSQDTRSFATATAALALLMRDQRDAEVIGPMLERLAGKDQGNA